MPNELVDGREVDFWNGTSGLVECAHVAGLERGLASSPLCVGLAAASGERYRYHCTPMTAKLEALIARAAEALGADLQSATHRALGIWLERLVEWNARIDLTAARTPNELVDLMVADAMVLAPHIGPNARVVDVGAGAGAPGLALAILRTDLAVTLVEPIAKRTSFLRTVVGALERTDVTIERARGDVFRGRRAWDVAVSRATLAPPTWLDLGTMLTAPGGIIWVLLAKDAPPIHARAAIEADWTYAWPLTGAERRAVSYRVLS